MIELTILLLACWGLLFEINILLGRRTAK